MLLQQNERQEHEDIHRDTGNVYFPWSNIWLESRSVFWNFLFSNPYRMILFFQVFNERGEKDRSRKN
jgi:hypothetical protein